MTQTPADLLREAATRIETALVLLNTAEHPCGQCGSSRYENFEHAKTYKQFCDTPQKLRDAADRLDKKASFTHQR